MRHGKSSPSINSTLTSLLTTYHELNSQSIDELTSEPSALEFMRYVYQNRPFIVRGGAKGWKATRRWGKEYLREVVGEMSVRVAVTPEGNADSVIPYPNPTSNTLIFVKPHETDEPFSRFLDYLTTQELTGDKSSEVKYAQTRMPYPPPPCSLLANDLFTTTSCRKASDAPIENDNLRDEYSPLFADVSRDIPWARIALQRSPEAINLWIGNSRSVTALHKDNYENIYVQVVGKKHFVLLPPIEYPCVGERGLQMGTYVRDGDDNKSGGGNADEDREGNGKGKKGGEKGKWDVRLDEGEEAGEIPFATYDPDHPDVRPTPFSHLSRPSRVTLEEGDMLYLPALWYDKFVGVCYMVGLNWTVLD
ncbi:MAG: hypothetical protein M1827_001483 [Pycnora praestabilis]|nr:MAG: hypothetical protein M1827_001483 [Pycnora praestabilis]